MQLSVYITLQKNTWTTQVRQSLYCTTAMYATCIFQREKKKHLSKILFTKYTQKYICSLRHKIQHPTNLLKHIPWKTSVSRDWNTELLLLFYSYAFAVFDDVIKLIKQNYSVGYLSWFLSGVGLSPMIQEERKVGRYLYMKTFLVLKN